MQTMLGFLRENKNLNANEWSGKLTWQIPYSTLSECYSSRVYVSMGITHADELQYSETRIEKENTMATNNICITKRQLAACIIALEKEVERITKAYEQAEGEYKDLLGERGYAMEEVLQALKARKVA